MTEHIIDDFIKDAPFYNCRKNGSKLVETSDQVQLVSDQGPLVVEITALPEANNSLESFKGRKLIQI
jgi:hypothetical protein